MAGLSTYEARRLINHQLRAATMSKRSNNYVALFTEDPTDAGSTTNEVPASNGYARVAIALSDALWTAPATSGSVEQSTNAANVTFGTPTGDWASGALISWWAIFDASTGGNMIMSGPIGTPRAVLATDNAPVFGPGSLVLNVS